MIDKFSKLLFSNKLTALALFVFACAIGTATFIESIYSTNAARMVVYNAKWFELIIYILVVNLIGNIFKYRLYRREKLVVFTFHVALIIVVIGAAVTRYFGFEGMISIPEGESSNRVISEQTFFSFQAHNGKLQQKFERPLLLNTLKNDEFDLEFQLENKNIRVQYVDYIPNARDTVIEDPNGFEYLELVATGQDGRDYRYLRNGGSIGIDHLAISYNDTTFENAVQIISTDSGLYFRSPYPVQHFTMATQTNGSVPADTLVPFVPRRLYNINQVRFVYSMKYSNVRLSKITTNSKLVDGEDVLRVKVTCDGKEKVVDLAGEQHYQSPWTNFQLGGLEFNLSYGSKYIHLPFQVRCDDFRLRRRPGSKNPESFESDLTIIDEANNYRKSHNIFMNHILDYGGYRFFQSSYFPDETGTVLSVNQDYWGTRITYIGYTLLFLGMILTLFVKNTRFAQLKKMASNLREQRSKLFSLIGLFLLLIPASIYAQQSDKKYIEINQEHAEIFARVLVQDAEGRTIPMHTMASELMRKVSKTEKYDGLNSVQVVLGMMYNPGYWMKQPIIYIDKRNPRLSNLLNNPEGKRMAYAEFYKENGQSLVFDEVNKAIRIPEEKRGTYEKELLKLGERLDLFEQISRGTIFKFFPLKNDPGRAWYSKEDYQKFSKGDTVFVKTIIPYYISIVHQAFESNDWKAANSLVETIIKFQKQYGGDTLPGDTRVSVEIMYNKLNLFQWLMIAYFLLGIILNFILKFEIMRVIRENKILNKIIFWSLACTLVIHALGLAARWYISEHAPWSNAYEAMLFISWVSILAGIVFSRSSKMALAATALVSGTLLMVAHLDWLNPQIGPVQPVLKSYWLVIHVACITSSYAFLILGSMFGLDVMIMLILKNKRNKKRVDFTIKELTVVNEMTLTVGLFLATIGTFLGGIWANESWGRYWGWDPKETWALVIVLYTAMVLHFRLIPKLLDTFMFNLASILGFGTVLMTFLGVNYYLVGKHSYAGGDTPPFPPFVIYLSVIIAVISVWAGIKYYRNKTV